MDMSLMLKEARQSTGHVPANAQLDLDIELKHMFSKYAEDDDKKEDPAEDDDKKEDPAKKAAADKQQADLEKTRGIENTGFTPEQQKEVFGQGNGMLPGGYDTRAEADAAAAGTGGGMLNRYSGGAAGLLGLLGAAFGGAVGGIKGAAGFGILGGILGLLCQKMGFMPKVFSDMIEKYGGDHVKVAQTKESLQKQADAGLERLRQTDPVAYNAVMRKRQNTPGTREFGAAGTAASQNQGTPGTPGFESAGTSASIRSTQIGTPEWAEAGATQSKIEAEKQRQAEANAAAGQPPAATPEMSKFDPNKTRDENAAANGQEEPGEINHHEEVPGEINHHEPMPTPVPVDARQKGQHNVPGVNPDTITAANPADSPSAQAMQPPPPATPPGSQAGGMNANGMGGQPPANTAWEDPQFKQQKEMTESKIKLLKQQQELEDTRRQHTKEKINMVNAKNQPPPPEPAPAPAGQPPAGLPQGGLFSGKPNGAVPGNAPVNAFQQQLNGAKQAVPNIPEQSITQGPASNANTAKTQTGGAAVQGNGGAEASKVSGNNNPSMPPAQQPPVPPPGQPLTMNVKKPIPGMKLS